MKAVDNKQNKFSMDQVCAEFNLKRDAYYKYRKRHIIKNNIDKKVVNLVRESRKTLPRQGTRKLLNELKHDFNKLGIKIGRDRLFQILKNNDMLIKRKRYSIKTTQSKHRFYKYKNIIKNLKVTKPNQVWVADITYIRTVNGFCYLALITDLYSRKIVGYDLSNSLELNGCIRALKKAIYNHKPKPGIIHHSDRGIQYCSNQYTALLNRAKFNISMTEENHCYENAVAERVNGILKDEFFLDQTFNNLKHAKAATKNAIKLYNNNKRQHLSLNFKTPSYIHLNVA